MKKAIVLSIFLFSAFSAFAEEEKIITVLDFETSGVSRQEMTLFVDYLSSSVTNFNNYILIDRRQREIILNEAQFSNSGCADESCAIEIGQLLSANEMIVGSLGSIGTRYLLNIKLIDVATGKTIRDVSEKYTSIDELVDGSENVVSELLSEKNFETQTVTDSGSAEAFEQEPPASRTDVSGINEPAVSTAEDEDKQPSFPSVGKSKKDYAGFNSSIDFGYGIYFQDGTAEVNELNISYSFTIVEGIYLGIGGGLDLVTRGYATSESDSWDGIYPSLLISGVFGDPLNAFGVSIDVGIHFNEYYVVPVFPAIGFHYAGFFVKITPAFIFFEGQIYIKAGYSFQL